jgi:DNA-binding response OmpR family regulator
MNCICLVHWKSSEAQHRILYLEKAGFKVQLLSSNGTATGKLRAHPPAAVIIDLSRMPSHGRDVAVSLRLSAATRNVPILFTDFPVKTFRVLPLPAFARNN